MTNLMLVVLGYALARVIDLACEWQRARLRSGSGDSTGVDIPPLSSTTPQHLKERHTAYASFRKSVNAAVEAAVNQGHGNYGMLYQIRDDYGNLLRRAPATVTQAADSVIRCVTLLANLGPSDQRYAMFVRALRHFDEECANDQGQTAVPPGPQRQEFSVIGSASESRTESDLLAVRAGAVHPSARGQTSS